MEASQQHIKCIFYFPKPNERSPGHANSSQQLYAFLQEELKENET